MTLFLRLLLLLGLVTSATAAEPWRVMSFNVRYATAADGLRRALRGLGFTP